MNAPVTLEQLVRDCPAIAGMPDKLFGLTLKNSLHAINFTDALNYSSVYRRVISHYIRSV